VTIGVLAIQGDYEAHARRLHELGAQTRFIRKPEELDGIDAIVIPGGESSTILKLLERNGFFVKLQGFVKTKPAFGTCAGAILLATEVENPAQQSLGALEMSVQRNGYGRQRESEIRTASTKLGAEPLEMVFIRAPKIQKVGPGVEVLAEADGLPVLVRHGKTMAATFHPELSPDTRVHAEFLKLVTNGKH
jgi:5'-phosphate synthase pdxT subunit